MIDLLPGIKINPKISTGNLLRNTQCAPQAKKMPISMTYGGLTFPVVDHSDSSEYQSLAWSATAVGHSGGHPVLFPNPLKVFLSAHAGHSRIFLLVVVVAAAAATCGLCCFRRCRTTKSHSQGNRSEDPSGRASCPPPLRLLPHNTKCCPVIREAYERVSIDQHPKTWNYIL